MYEYGNARLRAMRSRLLDRPTLEALVARYSLEHLVATLAATPYATELTAAVTGVGEDARDGRLVEAIDLALSRQVSWTGRAILGYYEGTARDLVGILLGRRDLQDVLTAIRGRAAGLSPEEISRLYLLGGELSPSWLAMLARADLDEAVRLAGRWIDGDSDSVAGALAIYHDSARIDRLETALVRSFYARALAKLGGRGQDLATVRRVIGGEIDVLNLTTAFRLAQRRSDHRPPDARELFMDGGACLTSRLLGALCQASDLEMALTELDRTPYGVAFGDAAGRLGRTGQVVALQRALERYLARQALSLYRKDPLGIGVVVGYLAAQSTEVANLRLIARGIALGVEKQDLFEEVWLPES